MKEATGEANMTVITIVIIGVVLAGVMLFLPNIISSIGNNWQTNCPAGQHPVSDVNGNITCK